MATKLPSTGGCDTSDMVMIHGMFRSVLADAPGLVRAVAPGDSKHTGAVADHVLDIASGLHNHHHGEDLLLWDQLAARAPACAAHVDQMRAQHAEVARHLESVEALVPQWREKADAASRDAVAEAVELVRDTLNTHLGAEETEILPVASTAFTQSEWNKLGEHGRASIPKERQFIQLGYILDSMSPDVARVWMKENLPAPVRLLYRLVGKRQYDAEKRALRNTAA